MSNSEESEDSLMTSSSEYDLSQYENQPKCCKLTLPEHIEAYYEKRELIREETVCEDEVVEKVMSMYIIAKKILSNICWQDKLICKHVCTTWRSAINTLAREQLSPVDFAYDCKPLFGSDNFKKSDDFLNEPLAVLMFANCGGLMETSSCKDFVPCPCDPPCSQVEHSVLDLVQLKVCSPKKCMLIGISCYLTYMPLPQSVTSSLTITHYHMRSTLIPFLGGIFIPQIPDVEFHVLNIRQRNRNTINLQSDFYEKVDKIAENRVFKGILVYVTENCILHTVDDILMLNYFKELQPDIPYALAGCIIEDTITEGKEVETVIDRINNKGSVAFATENLITISLFTVPKQYEQKENFDVFSLVIEKCEWTKPKIQELINDFAKKVPRFEHSVALKLSCVGRDKKHEIEQEYFRAAFPMTPIVGCYGNGELGLNHPPRAAPPDTTSWVFPKRVRKDKAKQDLMYSYSTIFMYIGWGKISSDD